jgi:hypothetical protein
LALPLHVAPPAELVASRAGLKLIPPVAGDAQLESRAVREDKAGMKRRGLLFLACALLVGCGQIRADFARQNALQHELDAYVIPRALEDVWSNVTQVEGSTGSLFWDGTSFTWADDGPWRKKTAPSTSTDNLGGEEKVRTTWFECKGQKVKDGSQVKYFQHTETKTIRSGTQIGTDTTIERRTDLELELVEKYDPAAAKRIRNEGERAAESGEWNR